MALFRSLAGSDILPIVDSTNDNFVCDSVGSGGLRGSYTSSGTTTVFTTDYPASISFGTIASNTLTYSVAGKYLEVIMFDGVTNARVIDHAVGDTQALMTTGNNKNSCVIILKL